MAAIWQRKEFFVFDLTNNNNIFGFLSAIKDKRHADSNYANAVIVDREQRGLSNGNNLVNNALVKVLKSNGEQSGSSAKSGKTSSYGYYSSPSVSSAPSVDYLDADLARHYGMDAKTAYQEALANTAIRRQMSDLKAAGLNPVLAANYGGSPSTIYNPTLQTEANYGNSGMYSGGSGSYRSSGKSGSSLLQLRSTQQAIAALGSAAVFAATKNFPLSASAYYGIQTGFNAFS